MVASAVHSVPMFLLPFSHKTPKPIHSLCFNPPSITLSRLSFHSQSPFSSCASVFAPKLRRHVFRVYGLLGDDSATSPQSSNSEPSASIDLNLPRRSLLVQFTCDLCGERTKRLVNRLAYERGAVFVQCAGCLKHHKLVDNLGLVTEYDFREKTNRDPETDQV